MAQEGSEGLMPRVRGGIGRLSDCLAEQITAVTAELKQSYETCPHGKLPQRQIPQAFQIPTVMDSSLAPAGYHIASAYGFYFPGEAEKTRRGKLLEQMARRARSLSSEDKTARSKGHRGISLIAAISPSTKKYLAVSLHYQ